MFKKHSTENVLRSSISSKTLKNLQHVKRNIGLNQHHTNKENHIIALTKTHLHNADS